MFGHFWKNQLTKKSKYIIFLDFLLSSAFWLIVEVPTQRIWLIFSLYWMFIYPFKNIDFLESCSISSGTKKSLLRTVFGSVRVLVSTFFEKICHSYCNTIYSTVLDSSPIMQFVFQRQIKKVGNKSIRIINIYENVLNIEAVLPLQTFICCLKTILSLWGCVLKVYSPNDKEKTMI